MTVQVQVVFKDKTVAPWTRTDSDVGCSIDSDAGVITVQGKDIFAVFALDTIQYLIVEEEK